MPGSGAGVIDDDLRTACLKCLELDRADVRAYADGKRWSVVADAFGDEYSIMQTIGLLNVVAAERGSDLRWARLGSEGHHAVIGAPKDGIRGAVERGYIELAPL